MLLKSAAPAIRFACDAPPDPGQTVAIAPGVLWLRLALPFRLDHVNVYLLEDAGGWTLLDTGLNNTATRAVWETMLARALGGRKLVRIIATHFHPDHVGLAGWLVERTGAALLMSQTEYLFGEYVRSRGVVSDPERTRPFYERGGLAAAAISELLGRGHDYLRRTTPLPAEYARLRAGDVLAIGGRDFEVLTGPGHAPEQVMLLCRADLLYFAADQVLAKISPNIGVWPHEPNADPLGDYLASLAALARTVPDEALLLPGHNLPFRGAAARIGEIAAHHDERCAVIENACRAAAKSIAELIPLVFHRELDPHQTGFAFAELLAHANYMIRAGRLQPHPDAGGGVRLAAR